MPDPEQSALAGTSVAAHLARGAIGFGLIGAAFVLARSHGPAALLLAAPGILALGGCPTCWIVGLVETISAGRLKDTCVENGCTLNRPDSTTAHKQKPKPRGEQTPRGEQKTTRSRAA